MKKNFLVIEDSITQAKYLEALFRDNKLDCTIVDTLKKTTTILKKQDFFMAFLDLNLPDGHGFEILEFINKNKLDVIVAVISVMIDPDSIIKSFKLGAVDYLVKPVKEDALLNAINNAKKKRDGGLPLLQKNLNLTTKKNLLTPREYEILKMIVSGDTYKKITSKLFISPNTLKVHTKSIFHKLLLKGRTEIVYQFNCCDIKGHLNAL